jgi:rhodanese-related sulfurtransferase
MIARLLRTAFVILFLSVIPSWCYTDITPAEVYTNLANGDTLILLDVREVLEYQYGHIAEPSGFLPITPANMPWSSNILQSEFYRLPTNVDIIVYCQSGGRSAAASAFLDTNGFTQIYNMVGGFGSWSFDTRDGGYGDHSGQWVRSSDPQPIEITCTGSGDTSKIIFPPAALPVSDSIYIELHFASNKPFIPPNVPQSDMNGLFRVSALDRFGLTLFDGDSLLLADTVNIALFPDFHSNIIFYPALKVFVPSEGWRIVSSNFNIPAFYRDETMLRKWYNGEGWITTDIVLSSVIPEQFEVQTFPNPFNGSIKILAPEEAIIFIYDIRGRLIEQLETENWSPDISLGSGIYILNVQYKNRIINKGIVYLK